jgi:hypothetical protein
MKYNYVPYWTVWDYPFMRPQIYLWEKIAVWLQIFTICNIETLKKFRHCMMCVAIID